MSQYKGSPLGIKFITSLYNIFGYQAAKAIVFVVALFYAVIASKKRTELDSYYKAVGLQNSFSTYFKHIYAFSLNIFDRFTAKEGMADKDIEVTRINIEPFESIQKSGGILILSHHGNWAQSFKVFKTYDIKLNIIGDEAMDENLTQAESAKDANQRINIISLKSGMQAMLDIARALQNQEIIIIMVDRVKEANKSVKVNFLGEEAYFHSGGFEIAQMRKVAMVGCDIARDGDQKIKIEFSDLITSDQKDKKIAIEELAQQYADFLQGPVKAYPYQWFNFFDFWKKP